LGRAAAKAKTSDRETQEEEHMHAQGLQMQEEHMHAQGLQMQEEEHMHAQGLLTRV
jgi:hypothetical protein